MSVEDAEHFYGILSKKYHWMTKLRQEREAEKAGKPIFKIEKVQRPKFEVWSSNFLEHPKSFHRSLGYSIKIETKLDRDGQESLRFKHELAILDDDSDDSGTSQGSHHQQKFSIDDNMEVLQDRDLFTRLLLKQKEAMDQLPDIDPGEEVDLFIKIGSNGPTFCVLDSLRPTSILSKFYRRGYMEPFLKSHPNLANYVLKKQEAIMDD
eukprot:CAMPEP_0170486034 /NCGR_PEP_ID=MMETSP0208-20121228/5159_1 /TAXON_ID=197538 /ORGANISM="Strombidium inclinatum, Strain S3" /LENGTH=207 /DNA_ID=CAMNT_0010759865 /DNA_START=483 /DNA_END=1103 /DNA_ORIENTATION=-